MRKPSSVFRPRGDRITEKKRNIYQRRHTRPCASRVLEPVLVLLVRLCFFAWARTRGGRGIQLAFAFRGRGKLHGRVKHGFWDSALRDMFIVGLVTVALSFCSGGWWRWLFLCLLADFLCFLFLLCVCGLRRRRGDRCSFRLALGSENVVDFGGRHGEKEECTNLRVWDEKKLDGRLGPRGIDGERRWTGLDERVGRAEWTAKSSRRRENKCNE